MFVFLSTGSLDYAAAPLEMTAREKGSVEMTGEEKSPIQMTKK